MPVNVLFSARPELWPVYEPLLTKGLEQAGVDTHLATDLPADQVDYVVYAPNGGLLDFTPYTHLKAVLSLWAGVEKIAGNASLTVPLARMVDHGLTQGMTEWVVGHVLRYHLGIDRHITLQDGTWTPEAPPLAPERTVCILGLGMLGEASARALKALGFNVTGWSRSPKDIPGVTCLHGDEGLRDALASAEIVVLLLPDTPATENLLNAETLALLPKGARLINPGRGPLIDDDALLDALNTGQIGHATLDVFRVEPLPADHPYWAHPNVTVTPHIASETRPVTAAQVIVENIRRGEAGEPYLHLVDRALGY
ncbi:MULTISPECIES: glyoxylate/hydroxypyruvate reductase A [unclassified Ruegeria]|uniref:2-hydroxyacid dehydrogenase n=1 Tax=unclassified Ruegeria TaxID=2625375 RepID=UPI001ADBC4E1|nr:MULTISPECIES: glyoxylate/hydroxypyruvate reductase A [unclassified Ruegeria]MBO9411494.1 glyoxylate/hydroxypyruvate reductase A [Ruegeria sp. R8_1]MBO9415944.1 glyoxylate/hydroxypyruvate reductase A [Ruegeria sp. R8_2]